MKRIVAFCFFAVTITACHKDKVETKPHITFKSVNTDVVDQNNTLRVTLDFTDQEGDLDSLYVIRQRVNKRGPAYRVLDYSVPEFSGQTKGQLLLTLNYQTDLVVNLNALRIPGSNPAQNEPDTLQLKFYVVDKAKNKSDSTAFKQIIVIR
jgi:hypothetical protein